MWQYCFSYFDICRQKLLLVLIEIRAEALASATSSWQGLSKAPGLTGLSVTSEWTQWTPWTPWTAVRSSVIWSSGQHLVNIWSTSGQRQHVHISCNSLVWTGLWFISGRPHRRRAPHTWPEAVLTAHRSHRSHRTATSLDTLLLPYPGWNRGRLMVSTVTSHFEELIKLYSIFLYILVYFHYRLSTSLLLWQSWKVHCLYSWPWKVYSSE